MSCTCVLRYRKDTDNHSRACMDIQCGNHSSPLACSNPSTNKTKNYTKQKRTQTEHHTRNKIALEVFLHRCHNFIVLSTQILQTFF